MLKNREREIKLTEMCQGAAHVEQNRMLSFASVRSSPTYYGALSYYFPNAFFSFYQFFSSRYFRIPSISAKCVWRVGRGREVCTTCYPGPVYIRVNKTRSFVKWGETSEDERLVDILRCFYLTQKNLFCHKKHSVCFFSKHSVSSLQALLCKAFRSPGVLVLGDFGFFVKINLKKLAGILFPLAHRTSE